MVGNLTSQVRVPCAPYRGKLSFVGQVEADHGKAAKAEFPRLERYQQGVNPILLARPLAAS
jgi:hypothetical protein